MEREGRLELVKDALRILVDELGPDDRVAVVTFGSDARLVLESDAGRTTAARSCARSTSSSRAARPTSRPACGSATSRPAESLTENGIDRVVVASDGVANVGLTDAGRDPARRSATTPRHGIELVSVGVGMGNYNDALLEQLADQGDGFYAYVNGIDDARTLFRERLTSTLQTVALDAKAQVEFDPRRRRRLSPRRLREPRRSPDGSFTDPRVDAGAIGAGHAVTALYAVRLAADGAGSRPVRDDPAALDRPGHRRDASDLARDVRGERPRRLVRRGPIRTSGWTPSWRPRPRSCATARTRTASASRTSSTWPTASADLPRSDQVDAFLDLLDAMRRIDD